MPRRRFLGLVAAVAATFPGRARADDAPPPPPCLPDVACEAAVVVFPEVGVEVVAEVAATPATRALGLGGHAPLGEFAGMLFAFDAPGRYPFWMKGMTFALDMLWLAPSDAGDSSLVVVHLAADVPPDPPGTPDGARPTYGPLVAATHVLEVAAGFTSAHGIGPGAIAVVGSRIETPSEDESGEPG